MASDSYIIKNLEKANISRADMVKNGFSGQKYDDVLRGKSSYKIPEIILISEKFQLSLDFLVFGKERKTSQIELTDIEERLLSDFRSLSSQGMDYIRQQMFIAREIYKKQDISKSDVNAG